MRAKAGKEQSETRKKKKGKGVEATCSERSPQKKKSQAK